MSAGDSTHDDLLEELRVAALMDDPVPERVKFAAKASLSWRTIDAELAQLTYDSVLDEELVGHVRGVAAARLLTFSTPELTLDVEVEGSGRDRRLIGELAPAQRAIVAIRHSEGVTEVETDDDGRFRTGPIPAGPIALSLRLAAGGSAVQTEAGSPPATRSSSSMRSTALSRRATTAAASSRSRKSPWMPGSVCARRSSVSASASARSASRRASCATSRPRSRTCAGP
jgi:hypothetical protein